MEISVISIFLLNFVLTKIILQSYVIISNKFLILLDLNKTIVFECRNTSRQKYKVF